MGDMNSEKAWRDMGKDEMQEAVLEGWCGEVGWLALG